MNSVSTRLRVAILLESSDVPAWQFALIESILESDCADIALLITSGRTRPSSRTHDGKPLDGGAVYRAFKRLEDKNRQSGPDACAVTSADSLLHSIDRITFAAAPGSQLDPAMIESIRAKQLDVLVALAEPSLLPSEQFLARLGVWYFEESGCAFSPPDGSMIGFRELVGRRPHLSSSLQILQPGAAVVRTAYQTCSAIDYMSHHVTRNEHLWKCSTFVSRAFKKCHEVGGETFLLSLQAIRTLPGEPLRSGSASSGSVALLFAFLSYFLWRIKRKILHRLYRERWILLFGPHNRRPNAIDFTKLVPPAGRFWADPHVIEKDGQHEVFFEDASQQTGIGHISLMSDKGNGSFTPPQVILRRPYHLSYPFVFEWRDTYFLIPESAENRTVELYRAARFPDLWTFEHNLMDDISAYDATLVEHGGLWWLFANVRERDGASSWDELCIFCADDPISRNWRPHRENPVISDVRRARPAGRFFVENGRLYRPSQDSSRRYGHALNINEVIELNDQSYREIPIEKIEPDWHRSIMGVHSYSRAGKLTFVDAIHREPRRRLAP
jgi:hypothetical protein